MNFSEAPQASLGSSKSQQVVSEQALLPFNSTKRSPQGLLHALEITQSRMTQHMNDKIFTKQKLSQQQSGHKKCISCEAWQEWASQSQHYILMIEAKLIQRQKTLQDKFIQMKNYLEREKDQFLIKERQYQNQKKSDSRKIQQSYQTIKRLEQQVEFLKKSSKITNKDSFSQLKKKCSRIQQQDDQNLQDIQTMRKVDNSHELKVKFQNDQAKKNSVEVQNKLSFRNFQDERNSDNERFLSENSVQTMKKLSPIDFETNTQSKNRLEKEQFEENKIKSQKRFNYINQQFSILEGPQRRDERKYQDNVHYKLSSPSIEAKTEKQQNKHLISSANKEYNIHFRPEVNLAEKLPQRLIKVQQRQRFIPNQNVTGLSESGSQIQRQRSKQSTINNLKRSPMQAQASKNSIQHQNTYKTIKLNHFPNNVEKSRFYQTATECSFVNGMKSRVSNISYKLPNDEATTFLSQCDDRSKEKCGNPERVEQKIREDDWRKITEEMQKLKFENQNLKSYNRVLLQKLSNSRPKKY